LQFGLKYNCEFSIYCNMMFLLFYERKYNFIAGDAFAFLLSHQKIKMKFLVRSLVCIMMVCFLGSWGFLVHKTAQQLAVYELHGSMQSFFYNNIDTLVANAIRPDKRRSYDKTEGAKHFIDLEAYGDSAVWKMPLTWDSAVAKFSKDTLLKYGYVPYVVMDIKNKLTNAFKNKNADSILFYAADIGHYIEDANVPLHTTVNHDGQLTNQKGLHALWESTVPSIEIANYNLYTRHKATYLSNPAVSIWTAIREAHALLPSLLLAEKMQHKKFSEEKICYRKSVFGKINASI